MRPLEIQTLQLRSKKFESAAATREKAIAEQCSTTPRVINNYGLESRATMNPTCGYLSGLTDQDTFADFCVSHNPVDDDGD